MLCSYGDTLTPSPTTAPDAHLEERYRSTRRGTFDRRLAWLVGSLAVVGGVAVLLLGGFNFANMEISANDVNHRILDDQHVEITVEVNARPNAPVACAFEVLSESHAPVGFKVVELPPTPERSRIFTTDLKVAGLPAVVHTKECWIVE